MVVWGNGEWGGGGQTERRAPQESKRELERRRRHPNLGVACWRVEGLQTIAGGAISFAPPPTPKPSTTSRTGRGGVQTCIWAAGQEKRRGHWSAVRRRAEDFWQTDDEGQDAAGGRRLNRLIWAERRQKGRKKRGDGKDALEGKEPGWILEGGERRGPETSRTGIHRHLNIGTESRHKRADALGKELHHPKTSKLWDSKNGRTDIQRVIVVVRLCLSHSNQYSITKNIIRNAPMGKIFKP